MIRRSYLFVPDDRPDRFEKAQQSGADAVILDLEDAVQSARKAGCRSRERGAHGPSPAVLRRTRGEERTVGEKDWETLTLVCDITIPELPLDKSPEEQLRFLRDYLARVRESTRYECYTYVERKVAELEAAADSPFMGA